MLLTGPGVERVLVPLCRAQEEGGGDEASDHAGADHLGGFDGRRDDDGDEAAAEEAALVERVDEGRPRRGQRQGAAQSNRVTLEMVHGNALRSNTSLKYRAQYHAMD